MNDNIKAVFTPDIWEAYEEGCDLPMHSETTLAELEQWAKSNNLTITQIDDTELD